MTFLSYYGIAEFENSAVILNSTSLRKRALAEVEQFDFTKIYLFLDNVVAGEDCKEFYKLAIDNLEVIDKS